jgi:hypothetical protein
LELFSLFSLKATSFKQNKGKENKKKHWQAASLIHCWSPDCSPFGNGSEPDNESAYTLDPHNEKEASIASLVNSIVNWELRENRSSGLGRIHCGGTEAPARAAKCRPRVSSWFVNPLHPILLIITLLAVWSKCDGLFYPSLVTRL